MIGLKKGTVKLSPHNPKWKELFQKEREALLKLDNDFIIDVNHIGSTSIPDIPAKPIIDMAVGIKSLDDKQIIIKLIESAGFQYDPDSDFEGRMFFIKGTDTTRTHHLSVVEYGGKVWNEYVVFANKVRNDQQLAKQYCELKTKLADKHKDNRKAYTDAKANFIQSVINN